MITCLIIDDEPLARSIIKNYLANITTIEIIGEFGDGLSALKGIKELKPDLIFLDIQLPKLTGLEVADLLESKPYIVFITAYNQYAIDAFELSALDYLLKPFTKERFDRAIQRVLERNSLEQTNSDKIDNFIESYQPQNNLLERIAVRSGNKIEIITASEITHLEAEGDYVMIFTKKGKFLKDRTMKYFETKLHTNSFVRIHRSTIVNIEEIKRIELFEKDSYIVVLKDGKNLKTSSSGYKLLKERLLL